MNTQIVTNRFFGDDTNKTYFEETGVMVMSGSASVWNDWNLTRDYTAAAGAGVPPRNTLVGNIVKDQFRVGDALQYQAQEALHDWKEGTDLHVHLHWATGGTNNSTVRGVKWELERTWANPLQYASGTMAFLSTTTSSVEVSIPALQGDRTHRLDSLVTISGTDFKIGSMMMMRLKRIASVTNPAPAADPFVISFGIHYQADTNGSRSISSK